MPRSDRSRPALSHAGYAGKSGGSKTDARYQAVTRKSLEPSLRSAVEPFIVMDVMRAAADREHAGERVVHMEVGQPGAPAPKAVVAAAHEALADGRLGYTEALGNRRLRQRIVDH